MSPDKQFWWDWWVQALTAAGTIGAVVVALFGPWIRALLPPRLHISVPNPLGEPSPAETTTPDGTRHKTESRWYHVHVENRRRALAPAAEVQVFLHRIEQFDPAVGQYRRVWFGEIPLQWKNQHIKPVALTIGRPDGCDLVSITKDPLVLALHPLVGIFSLNAEWREAVRLLITLQARGVETDSNVLRVEISWDGRWSDDPVDAVTVKTI